MEQTTRAEETSKPLVYFVRKSYGAYAAECQNAEDRITESLSKKFEIKSSFNLGEETIQMVKEDVSRGILAEAMITHIPPNQTHPRMPMEPRSSYYERLYQESRTNLLKINIANPLMPIIIYTGADRLPEVTEVFLNLHGMEGLGPAKEFVFKNRPEEWYIDAASLEGILNDLIK